MYQQHLPTQLLSVVLKFRKWQRKWQQRYRREETASVSTWTSSHPGDPDMPSASSPSSSPTLSWLPRQARSEREREETVCSRPSLHFTFTPTWPHHHLHHLVDNGSTSSSKLLAVGGEAGVSPSPIVARLRLRFTLQEATKDHQDPT